MTEAWSEPAEVALLPTPSGSSSALEAVLLAALGITATSLPDTESEEDDHDDDR